ncbi:growth hormone-regulated TBC protein 1-A isoform X2 [Cylas formicarius]|uniref:growth hormone-regulated TBC protein 1-A isoform X2 n=1 Tax=Cylas formicarius TaxID=197179 RepID=UPI002958D467|nr:growth hormone-regulated TBC protein 1-A isoform X2 [Cylas formicarius]
MSISPYRKVDEYGFERPDNFSYLVYDKFVSHYMRVLTRRAQRWNLVFRGNSEYKKSNTLKRFVRKGIPSHLRINCWMVVSGGEKLKNQSSLSYLEMKDKNRKTKVIESIQIDLPRTFPDNIFFSSEDNLFSTMLYDVLATFAQQNSEVGYCQGLNYIVGLTLLVTKDEEASFWLLKVLVEQMLPKYYVKTMSGLLTDLDVLNELVQKAEPVVHRHIQNVGMPWAMGTTKWFICLYADVLPPETVLRIWDCLFYEGSKIIFRVALALIKIHKDVILQTSDLSELMAVFRDMKNHERTKLLILCVIFNRMCLHYPGACQIAKYKN